MDNTDEETKEEVLGSTEEVSSERREVAEEEPQTADSAEKKDDIVPFPRAVAYVAVAGALGFLSTASYLSFFYAPEAQLPIAFHSADVAPAAHTMPTDPFSELRLEASAAIVWDVETGEAVYAYNEERQLPLASLAKLMTALASMELLGEERVVRVESDAVRQEGDTGLLVGEEWSVRDLIDFMLVSSSNDGAYALAAAAGSLTGTGSKGEDAFVERMNGIAEELGLAQTYFLNGTGLDPNDSVSGSYGSAKDVALLVEHILKTRPELLEATTYPAITFFSESGGMHTATNTNDSIPAIPGLIGSKTGFTNLAGGNLVVAFDVGVGRPFIAAVLGSTPDGRMKDIEQLVWAAIRAEGYAPSE